MHRRTSSVLLALMLSSFTATALEPPPAPSAAESYRDSGSVRSKSDEWMIPPGKTGTLGAELAFLTARGPLSSVIGNPALYFTDVVFLRLQGRYSVAGVAELIVDTSLLPKQPSYTEELVFQNGGLGFRVGIAGWLAAALRFDGGATLEAAGAWGQTSLGLEARLPIDDYVLFDLAAFGAGTALLIDEQAPRFAELGTSAQVVFFNPGAAGVWLGASFHFPIASHSAEIWPIDPPVRLSANVGAVLTAIDDWDLYAKFSYVDRGDLVDLETILPILDGGFDQQVLTFGVVRRFGDEPNGTY